jgi:hypothetical protein
MSDKVTYTPGPWRIGTSGSLVGANFSLLARKQGGWVNILHGNDCHTTETRATREEAYANAKLMAAAPDLLEALQLMVKQFTKVPSTYADSDARVKAHTAIKKATGDVPSDVKEE